MSYYSQRERRWPTADAIPDIDRIARQQDFVRRLVSEAASHARNDPLTANAIVNRVLENLTIDSGLSRDDVLTLVDTFLDVNLTDTRHVQFETIPSAEGPNQQGESVLYPHEPEASAMISQLAGTGIGDNPSVKATPTSSPPSTGGTISPVTTTPVKGSSGVLHASIANQSTLGPPAARAAPC